MQSSVAGSGPWSESSLAGVMPDGSWYGFDKVPRGTGESLEMFSPAAAMRSLSPKLL